MDIERKATPQDISWFLDLKNNNQIDLEPPYQRKSVWNKTDREFYLDTIMNNCPCPAIFLYKDIDGNGRSTYRVIDGKQRLTTIFDFAEDKIKLSKDIENTELKGKLFSELKDAKYKKRFWNYSIPVEQINTDSPEIIKSIFDRLNRNNKKLTRQELRKAKYDGELYQFVSDESIKDFWSIYVLIGPKDKARMEDQQFISELALLTLTGETQGFDQDALDQLYSDYDTIFEEKETINNTFEIIKTYIQNIDGYDNIIQKSFKTRGRFYTLWNYLLANLNNLPAQDVLGKALNEMDVKAKTLSSEELARESDTYIYYKSLEGPVTDKKPRIQRYEAFSAIIEKYRNENN